MRWIVISIISVLIISAGSYGTYEFGRNHGWWGDNDKLRELKADPMAEPDLLGLKLEKSDISKAPGITGKTGPTYLTRWFKVQPGNQDEAVDKLASYAEKNGWVKDESLSREDLHIWLAKKPSTAAKAVDGSVIDSILSINSSEKGVIRVSLHY